MAEVERQRRLEPELMDDPGLDAGAHRDALRGLARINTLSRAAAALWPPIRDAVRAGGRPMRLLDVACGGGDVTIALQQRARRERLPLTVHGCDLSETALEVACRRAAARGLDARMHFHRRDVIDEGVPPGYDIAICSLFLHHLPHAAAVSLLRAMASRTRLVVASDLRRGRGGLIAASIGVRLFSRSAVVHVDGPRSVRAAFSMSELRELAEEAGLEQAHVRRCFPFRMLMSWSRE